MSAKNSNPTVYQLHPIGYVRRTDQGNHLEILEPFRPALKQLEHFSHVIVLWWADQLDTEEYRGIMQTNPYYAEDVLTGIFATRAPCRPNPVALTTCKMSDVDEGQGIVRIGDIDAMDGSPVVDLKAYMPVCDRVEEVHIPDWLPFQEQWMPEEGLDLEPMPE